MKKIVKLVFVLGVFAALASCSSHEKCPTYSGEIEVEKPVEI